MTAYTRRTHIVRITQDPPSDVYIDVEVLDAIAFRDERNKEMVLSMDNASAVAYIKDETGGGHAKFPSDATRLSHMKRIVGSADPTQKLDIEIIDVVAFRDSNGEEWILDMQATTGEGPDLFDTTDGSGTVAATRRVHQEKISTPFAEKSPKQFITVKRCDAMAFRTIMGREMVIKCPSNDDPNTSDPRAATYISSPAGYDPADDEGPKPPENSDPNQYIAFVKNADGFITGNAEIMQGPIWWIRKISSGGSYILVTIVARNESNAFPPDFPTITIDLGNNPKVKLLDKTETRQPIALPPRTTTTTVYFVWNDMAPFPTAADFDNVVHGGGSVVDSVMYAQQFSRIIWIYAAGLTTNLEPNIRTVSPLTEPYIGNGFFPTLEAAGLYASAINNAYPPGHFFAGYFDAGGSFVTLSDIGTPGPALTVYAAQLEVPVRSDPFYASVSTFKFLYSIPTSKQVEKFTPVVTLDLGAGVSGSSTIFVQGFSDVKKALKKVTDAEDDPTVHSDPVEEPQRGQAHLNPGTINGTYTVTQSVIAGPNPTIKPHQVTIKIDGGDTDGG